MQHITSMNLIEPTSPKQLEAHLQRIQFCEGHPALHASLKNKHNVFIH